MAIRTRAQLLTAINVVRNAGDAQNTAERIADLLTDISDSMLMGAEGSPVVTVTAQSPQDEGPVAFSVNVTPAPTNGTQVAIRLNGEATAITVALNSGTGNGQTTALAAGTHVITARYVWTGGGGINVDGSTSVVVQNQLPTVVINLAGGSVSEGLLAVPLTVTHPSAPADQLTVQVALSPSGPWVAAAHGAGNSWAANLNLVGQAVFQTFARAWDNTPGGSVVNATPVIVNTLPNYVRITVTNSDEFMPQWELAVGSVATVTTTCEETGQALPGVTPVFEHGSVGTRHYRLTCTNWAEFVTFNIGFNVVDDRGDYDIGAQYNRGAQQVTAIENMGLMAPGLRRFCAARTPVTSLDFTGFENLEFVECFQATALTSVTMPATTRAAVRVCFEQCALTSLDLTGVAPLLRDLRAAAQQSGTLTLTHGGVTFTRLYHFCVRDQLVTNPPAWSQLPAIREFWAWNTGRTGALAPVSSATQSLQVYSNSYTSLNVAAQFPAGRNGEILAGANAISSVNITGCPGLTNLDLHTNALSRDQVDSILTTLNSFGTANGVVNVLGNSGPSLNGAAAAAALQSRGWTVSREATVSAGVDVDEFERNGAVGNGWASLLGGATATCNGTALVRTENNGYCIYGNAGDVVTTSANYEVQTEIPVSTANAGFFGLVGRWTGGNGVRCLWYSRTECHVGDAAGFNHNDVNLTVVNALPASWTGGAGPLSLAMRMQGTTVSIYCNGTLYATATLATNATATGTSYGNCGEGGGTHIYNRMAVVTV